jgi:adenylate kinase
LAETHANSSGQHTSVKRRKERLNRGLKLHLIMFGAPGSGKGTHSEKLAQFYGVPHISTGDVLRENVAGETELGRMVEEYVKRGEYVPDATMNYIVKSRLGSDDCEKGFILDGYPRTIAQIKALENILEELNLSLDAVINLQVSEEEIVRRLSSRRVCLNCQAIYNTITHPPKNEGVCDVCGGPVVQRDDDKPDVIRNRLKIYEVNTKPLLKYYEKMGIVVTLKAEGEADEVSRRIRSALEKALDKLIEV